MGVVGTQRSNMGSRTGSQLLTGAAVVLLVLLQGTQAVYIKYQGFQVQLESVQKMRDLERQQAPSDRLHVKSLLPSVCQHPALPQDLQPICTSTDAARIFVALKTIASDDCELCVNVACTGCFNDQTPLDTDAHLTGAQ